MTPPRRALEAAAAALRCECRDAAAGAPPDPRLLSRGLCACADAMAALPTQQSRADVEALVNLDRELHALADTLAAGGRPKRDDDRS